MSKWRKKALELFCDQRHEFQHGSETIYTVFRMLLSRVQEAHERNDIEELHKIYDYAEWCFSQKEKNLWNAAAVSFYEHLGDTDVTFEAIPYWVKPQIFAKIQGLYKFMLTKEEYNKLLKKYNEVNNTAFE